MDPSADSVRAVLERALGGQYRILRLIGRGGMGVVYLGRDEALERLVAIKVLSSERGPDAESRERFRREARTAARLTHPNIVPLYGFGEAEGMPYLVMGYVRGESLAARLRREGRLAVDEARRVLAELAEALDHAHRQGVVHRDVKPDNVVIDDESGRALLTDFGIAKAQGGGGTLTEAGAVIGTPEYMSPEQAGGGEADARADLYSLGALAFAMLAGRPPFDGAGARELILQQLSREPPHLAKLRPDVPDDLAAAIMRCLAKDPAARWPDARSLREAVAPTGLDDEQLPEPLDALDGIGPALLPFAILFVDTLWYWGRSTPGTILLVLAAGVLVYQAPWIVSSVRLARQRGFSSRQIVGAFLRQPTWWYLLWYPRRFRRPGDVWDRLPLPFRIWRLAATGLVAAVPFLVPIVILGSQLGYLHPSLVTTLNVLSPAWLLVTSSLVLTALVALAFGGRYVLGLGLDVYQRRLVASAFISRPTCRRSLWRKPEIVRALLPPRTAVVRSQEPRLPREFPEALAREAARQSGASREALERAAAEARELVSEIEALDADLAGLGGDADPEEVSRVRRRIEALGPEADAEGDERRQMRRLLAQQQELLGKAATRLDAARAQRAERLEALQALWRSATAAADSTTTKTAARV